MRTSSIAQEELQRIKETIQASKQAHPSSSAPSSWCTNSTSPLEKEIETLLLLLSSTLHQYEALADKYISDPFSSDFEAVQLHTKTVQKALQVTRKRLEKYQQVLHISESKPLAQH